MRGAAYSQGSIGGWTEHFSAALAMARGHGRELAMRHMRSGYGVIPPQLVTNQEDRVPEPAFEEAVSKAEAIYIQWL